MSTPQERLTGLCHTAADAFEKRIAKEALAAWRAGYRYLEVRQPIEQVPVYDELESFDIGLQAAFLPRRSAPHDARPGARREYYKLDVLDDRTTRQRLKNLTDTDP